MFKKADKQKVQKDPKKRPSNTDDPNAPSESSIWEHEARANIAYPEDRRPSVLLGTCIDTGAGPSNRRVSRNSCGNLDITSPAAETGCFEKLLIQFHLKKFASKVRNQLIIISVI
jgi:hypothetical protein